MEIGPGVAGSSVPSLHFQVSPYSARVTLARHTALRGLHPSSWFSGLPTTPQPRAPSRRLRFLLNQENADIYLVQGLKKQH